MLRKPSPAGVAIFAFLYNNRYREGSDMYRNTHSLTSLAEMWLTAYRLWHCPCHGVLYRIFVLLSRGCGEGAFAARFLFVGAATRVDPYGGVFVIPSRCAHRRGNPLFFEGKRIATPVTSVTYFAMTEFFDSRGGLPLTDCKTAWPKPCRFLQVPIFMDGLTSC